MTTKFSPVTTFPDVKYTKRYSRKKVQLKVLPKKGTIGTPEKGTTKGTLEKGTTKGTPEKRYNKRYLERERFDDQSGGVVGLLRVHEGVPRSNGVHQKIQLFAYNPPPKKKQAQRKKNFSMENALKFLNSKNIFIYNSRQISNRSFEKKMLQQKKHTHIRRGANGGFINNEAL